MWKGFRAVTMKSSLEDNFETRVRRSTKVDERKPEPFAANLNGRRASFRAAAEGVIHVVRTQPNVWIESLAAIVVAVAGWWFRVSTVEWALLVVMVVLVLALEAVNTAIERVVDLVSPKWHPLAKHAKDAAAGALLIAALGSLIVSLLVFVPYIRAAF